MLNRRRCHRGVLATIAATAAIVVGPLAGSSSAIIIAGSLVVDMNAANVGDVITDAGGVRSWANNGTAATAFTQAATPAVQPQLQILGGAQAVVFDGVGGNATIDRLEAPPAPASVTGASDWSFEAWAFNPSISTATAEETIFQWGPRGGVTGLSTAAHVGMGFAGPSGAVVHWGADQGYAADSNTTAFVHDSIPALDGNAPTPGVWQYIAVTYTGGVGGTESVYLDGVLNTSALRSLNISTAINMIVGTAYNNSSNSFEVPGSLGVARIRLHDGVLSASDVLGNFQEEASAFGRAVPTAPEPTGFILASFAMLALTAGSRPQRRRS